MGVEQDEELQRLRKQRLAEMQNQAIAKQQQEEALKAQREQFEAQKYALLRKILSPEARQRLENIRMVRPQFAERIEMQLIQLAQTGQLRGAVPISDAQLKELLARMTGKKKDIRIKKIG
ncbi:MAG: DNA-binding protein [Promethearchaeota archaeon]